MQLHECKARETLGSLELVKQKIETSVASSSAGRRVKAPSKRRVARCEKSVMAAFEEHCRHGREDGLRAIAITLTYRAGGEYCPRHLSRVLTYMKVWLNKIGYKLAYVWVLENAEVLHYHLQIWLPRGVLLEKDRLKSWWPHGSTWIEQCQSPYAWARYLAKAETKAKVCFPKGARLFGQGGFDESGKENIRRARLPKWLRDVTAPDQRLERKPWIGWVDADTGESFRSPWVWACGRWKQEDLFLRKKGSLFAPSRE